MIGWIAIGLLAAPAALADPLAGLPAGLLQGAPCRNRVIEMLTGNPTSKAWRPQGDWIVMPGDEPGEIARKAPTERLGTWVELRISASKQVRLTQLSASGAIEATWIGPECRARLLQHPMALPSPLPSERFTDGDLERLKRSGTSALIYLWSPHMPLSIRGFADAQASAHRHGLQFEPILDPQAEAAVTARALKQNPAIPSRARRRAISIELLERGAHLHYPATLVFHRGKVGRMLPGLWDSPEVLEKHVRASLQEASP
jgi:hypothetical protein